MPGILSEGSATSAWPQVCSTAEEADLCAQMLWIGGDGAQRLRRRPEQDVVDHGLVLERDDLDLRRHGEHDVEIRHVKQFRLPVRNPLGACQALALRAVAVTTRVVGDALMAAFAATFDVTAERCRAAALDRDHGTAARAGQRTRRADRGKPGRSGGICPPLPAPRVAWPCRQAGVRVGTLAITVCKASSGLAVAQTLLVAIRR